MPQVQESDADNDNNDDDNDFNDDDDHRRAQAPAFSTLAELEELMAWGINIVKDPDGAYYPDGPGTESYWLPYR